MLAVAVGNLDMHAKNVSMLHLPDGTAQIAPAYDIVPLRHQPTDGRLALAVNGVYVHATVTADDLVAEGSSWGVASAEAVVREVLTATADVVDTERPDLRADPRVRDDIVRFTANLLGGEATGGP